MVAFQGCVAAADPNIPPAKFLAFALEAGLGLNIDDDMHVVENESVVKEEF